MFKCQICQQSSRKPYNMIQKGRQVSYTNTLIKHPNPKKTGIHYSSGLGNSKGCLFMQRVF